MNIDTIKGVSAIAISVFAMIGGLTLIYYKQNPIPVEQNQQIQRPLTVDDVELIFHRMNRQNEAKYKVFRFKYHKPGT